MKNSNISKLIPIFLAFFAMGFVDMVGTANNYVKADFMLSDKVANLLMTMVFVWFFLLSIPTGMLMNRIGRRKTVLLSLAVTVLALVAPLLAYVPFIGYNFPLMLVSFSLLGIGNTLMQVSLNPLISNIVSKERMASTLTLGQFVKAIASFLAPVLAAWLSVKFGDWKLLFPIWAIMAAVALIYLGMTQIDEQKIEGRSSTFGECLGLLGDKLILLLFLGILVHVGIDVGINATAPKILIDRLGYTNEEAGFATSFYFMFRLGGCLLGAFILAIFSKRKFFIISVLLLLAGIGGLLVAQNLAAIYTCIAMIGLGNANIFSIMFSQAIQHHPAKGNEISALMITGVGGGAIIPLLMGIASDAMSSQQGAVIVLGLCVVYLLMLISVIKK